MAKANRRRGQARYSSAVEALVALERSPAEVPEPVRTRLLARARAVAQAASFEDSDRQVSGSAAGDERGVGRCWTGRGAAGGWHDC